MKGKEIVHNILMVTCPVYEIAYSTVKVAKNVSDLLNSKKENEKLREELRKTDLDNATKQEVIRELNKQVEKIKKELEKERKRADKNEEIIRCMEEQLEDLINTNNAACIA